MINETSFGTPDRVFICLLTLTLRPLRVGGFSNYFSFICSLVNSCCFWKKRPSSLDFALNFQKKNYICPL